MGKTYRVFPALVTLLSIPFFGFRIQNHEKNWFLGSVADRGVSGPGTRTSEGPFAMVRPNGGVRGRSPEANAFWQLYL